MSRGSKLGWGFFNYHLMFLWPLNLLLHTKLGNFTSNYSVKNIPTLGNIAATLVACSVALDITYYFSHRLLHTPWLYRNVNYWHHGHTATFSLSAFDIHPIETSLMFLNAITGPVLIPSHLVTIYLWVGLVTTHALRVHSGFDFPLAPERCFSFIAGPKHHDYHHMRCKFNFGQYFTWLYHIFGTAAPDDRLKSRE